MDNAGTDFASRLKTELLRDKKKAIVMAVLTAVCAILVIRAVVKIKPSPSSAAGAVAAPAKVRTTSADPMPAEGDNPPLRHKADQEKREEYLSKMDRQIRRDLFRVNLEAFPTGGSAGEVEVLDVTVSSSNPGFVGELAQTIRDVQMAHRDQADRLNAIQAEARALCLQSTIMGSCPTALINGQVLHVGDSINRFLVKEISSTACVVSREGVELEVPMSKEKH